MDIKTPNRVTKDILRGFTKDITGDVSVEAINNRVILGSNSIVVIERYFKGILTYSTKVILIGVDGGFSEAN